MHSAVRDGHLEAPWPRRGVWCRAMSVTPQATLQCGAAHERLDPRGELPLDRTQSRCTTQSHAHCRLRGQASPGLLPSAPSASFEQWLSKREKAQVHNESGQEPV